MSVRARATVGSGPPLIFSVERINTVQCRLCDWADFTKYKESAQRRGAHHLRMAHPEASSSSKEIERD